MSLESEELNISGESSLAFVSAVHSETYQATVSRAGDQENKCQHGKVLVCVFVSAANGLFKLFGCVWLWQ